MPLHFNPTKVKESGPSYLIGKGWHLAKVVQAIEAVSKKGNQMWVMDYIIVDGAWDGKPLKDWVTLTDAALWRAKWMLADMGFDMDKDAEVDIHADDLRNRTIGIEIEHVKSAETDDDGKPYTNAKIKSFCRPEHVADNIKKQIEDGKGMEVPKESEIPF